MIQNLSDVYGQHRLHSSKTISYDQIVQWVFNRTLHCAAIFMICCLSCDCLSSSVTRVYCDKTTEVRITRFLQKGA